MCRRYVFATDPQQIAERFALACTPPDLPTRYNVAPQTHMPVVVGGSPNHLDIMRWGLVPSWAKQEGVGHRMINARTETVAERPGLPRRPALPSLSGARKWLL